MTGAEWADLVINIERLWPGRGWPKDTARIAGPGFAELEARHVSRAIRELWEEGREFPPSTSVVYARAVARHESSLPALSSDATRDLTPEEMERNRNRRPLAELIAEVAERRDLNGNGS